MLMPLPEGGRRHSDIVTKREEVMGAKIMVYLG
jgi:hypothetical protein